MVTRNLLASIERRGTAQDGAGQVIESWTEQEKAWVSIVPVSGREYFAASGERAEITHKISMAYGPTVLPRDRITWAGRTFDIRSALNVEERNRELTLMCTEVLS